VWKKGKKRKKRTGLLGGQADAGRDRGRPDHARRHGVHERPRARLGVLGRAGHVGLGLDREDVGLAGRVFGGVAEALEGKDRSEREVERGCEYGAEQAGGVSAAPSFSCSPRIALAYQPSPRSPPHKPHPLRAGRARLRTDRGLDEKSRPSFLGSAAARVAAVRRAGSAVRRAAGARKEDCAGVLGIEAGECATRSG